MKVLISQLHYPVTALGPGRRAGIWFQGCTIQCPGCVSGHTWGFTPRATTEVDAVLSWLSDLSDVDGVTISGGEPTDQPQALAALLRGIDAWRADRPDPRPDVLLFTGRELAWLDTPNASALDGVDAVVIGLYIAAQAGTSRLRGSENQELVFLTPLGKQRYPAEGLTPREQLQIEVTKDHISMIGIPLPGTLKAVEAAMAQRGVTWGRRSWTS